MVRLAITVMGKAAGRESILPARITNCCRSLVLGAGPVVGVKGRPLFTRPMAVWHHLKRLQRYNSEPRAQQQQSQVAKQRQKRRRAQGKTADVQMGNAQPRQRCLGKGGAKKAATVYASDFYAGLVLPEGARRGVRYRVEEPSGGAATPAPRGGAVLFTPPQRCAVARRPDTRPRLPRLWLCAAHNRQCSTCVAVGRGVRHCCARRHPRHCPLPAPPGTQRGRRGCTPQEGGGPPQLSGPSVTGKHR